MAAALFDIGVNEDEATVGKRKNGKGASVVNLPPPLKWAGGKRWLVPVLQELYAPHRQRRLVEPFVGGMAVALGLLPDQALLSDINPHLINFYRWLQKDDGLCLEIETVSEEDKFYAARARFNELLSKNEGDTKEAAELFYYLNRTCFNGLCRFNNRGQFNVPFGKYKNPNYVKDFRSYAELLQAWTLNVGTYESLEDESLGSKSLRPDDFIYADPPYDVEFTKYAKEDFTAEDQTKLARWLLKHKGPVVVSNQATQMMRDIYGNGEFDYVELPAPRRISCTGDRRPAIELLAARNLGDFKLSRVLEKLGYLK